MSEYKLLAQGLPGGGGATGRDAHGGTSGGEQTRRDAPDEAQADLTTPTEVDAAGTSTSSSTPSGDAAEQSGGASTNNANE